MLNAEMIPRVRDRTEHNCGLLIVGLAGLIGFGGCTERSAEIEGNTLAEMTVLASEERFVIGDAEDPADGFSMITSFALGDDGTLYLSEGFEIRVYDQNGDRIRTFGGQGTGPGKFTGFPRIGVVGDTVWAVDHNARRVALFTTSGSHLSTAPYEGLEVELQPTALVTGIAHRLDGTVVPLCLRTDGAFLSQFVRTQNSRTATGTIGADDTVRVPIVRFGPSGEIIDTVGWELRPPTEPLTLRKVNSGGLEYAVPVPPNFTPLRAARCDGRVEVGFGEKSSAGGTNTIYIVRTALEGDTLYHREYTYKPLPYPEWYLGELALQAAGAPGVLMLFVEGTMLMHNFGPGSLNLSEPEMLRASGRIRSSMQFHAQPPVAEILSMHDGSLWLRREVVDPETTDWLILDRQGEALGQLSVPSSLRPLWADTRVMWAVDTDEIGVQWLKRFEFSKSPS